MPAPKPIALVSPSRRLFLFETTAATLSGAAIALLAGVPRLARAASPAEGQALTDIQILNAALAAERGAIAAYQVGAESGLLKPPALKTALQFQRHHKAHAGVLAGSIKKLGGQAAEAGGQIQFPGGPVQEAEGRARIRGQAGARRGHGLRRGDSEKGENLHSKPGFPLSRE